jgi:putative ABC transport system permease protein
MIRNYIIIAWRNLLRNKFISLINIGGLAIGISTFMIIAIYVSYELSYDELVPNKGNIFRVTKHWLSPYNTTGKPDIADAITKSGLADLSGINKIGRLYHHPSYSIPSAMVSFYDDLAGKRYSFEEFDIYKAEQEILDIFQLPFVYGNPESALSEMYTAIISESIAIKYFGECSNDIIGKTLFISQDEDIYEENFTIKGIFKDLPYNSHLKFDMLISYETYSIIDPKRYEEGIGNARFHCYLELNGQTNPKQLEEQIQLTMDSLRIRRPAARGVVVVSQVTSQ